MEYNVGAWKRRKADPMANILKERSIDWILSLPPHVRPHNTAKLYPRIVNDMAIMWENPRRFDTLLFSYVKSDRPTPRKGFPGPVMTEINALRNYIYEKYPELIGAWGSVTHKIL